jgi:hypothetical protein
MAIPTIKQLEDELLELVRSVPAFNNRGFSIYSLEDLAGLQSLQEYPVCGVGYDGAQRMPAAEAGIPSGGPDGRAHGVSVIVMQFLVVIAIQYRYSALEEDDTKPQAYDLLDEVRKKVLGYKGVNSRPWRYVGERPEPQASGQGIAFYSQIWHTTTPVVGSFNNAAA